MPADPGTGPSRVASTVPDWLNGAWWRTRAVVDGRVVHRPGPALWVQDGQQFVDVRGPGPSPLDGPRVVAGVVSWEPPFLRWHHVVDSAPEDRDDVARIARRGETILLENGMMTTARGSVAYHERWQRLGAEHAPTVRRDQAGFVVLVAAPLPLELRIEARLDGPDYPPAGGEPADPGKPGESGGSAGEAAPSGSVAPDPVANRSNPR